MFLYVYYRSTLNIFLGLKSNVNCIKRDIFFCNLPFSFNIILGASVRVFLVRLTSELVDWVKQIALPEVCGPHPISWRPEEDQKPYRPVSKREFFLPDNFELGHWFFSLLSDSKWNIGSFWVLSFLAFRLELPHQCCYVSSLPAADLGTCQPP